MILGFEVGLWRIEVSILVFRVEGLKLVIGFRMKVFSAYKQYLLAHNTWLQE